VFATRACPTEAVRCAWLVVRSLAPCEWMARFLFLVCERL